MRASSVSICAAAPSLRAGPAFAVGGDRGEPPRGNFGLARQRLRFRAHLGELRALAFDLAAHRGEPAPRYLPPAASAASARSASLASGARFVAARRQSRLRLAERRQARGVAARSRARPRPGARARRAASCWSSRQRARAAVSAAAVAATSASAAATACCLASTSRAHRLQLRLDVGEPVLAGEAPAGAGRRIGGDRKSVPAPEVAVARDQPLAGLEHRRQARGVRALDHADLREASRQLLRRLDVPAERLARHPAAPDRRDRWRRRPSAWARRDRSEPRGRRRARRRARPRNPCRR